MSGGYFGYLCCVYDNDGIGGLINQRNQLIAVQKALLDYPHSEFAIASIARLLKAIDDADEVVRLLLNEYRLADVLKAVEWHRSGDWGSEQVEQTLSEFNKRVLP